MNEESIFSNEIYIKYNNNEMNYPDINEYLEDDIDKDNKNKMKEVKNIELNTY